MKKGFTLIELLAVIAILAIIMLIATPRILDAIENARLSAYHTNEQMMVKATETYLGNNPDLIPETANNIKVIPIADLKSESLISEIKDNYNNDCSGYIVVSKTKTNEVIYNPYLECGNDYQSYEDYIQEGLVVNLDGYDAPDGNYWKDRSSYHNDAIINTFNPNLMYNDIAKEYKFYQEAGNLQIADNDSIDLVTAFTIEMIFNTGKDNSYYAAHPFQKSGGTEASNLSPYLFGNYDGQHTSMSGNFVMYATRGGVWGTISPIIKLNWEERYHIVFTFDTAVGGKLYINNEYKGINTNGKDKLLFANTVPLTIDNFNSTDSENTINLFRVYNRELTEEELNYNYDLDKKRFGL